MVLLFNKGVDDVLVHVKRANKTDGFTGQSLDARSERQVVTLDTRCEDFPGQMYLAWDFLGVASQSSQLEGDQQAQQSTACFIVALAESIGKNAFSFGIKGIPKPMSMFF